MLAIRLGGLEFSNHSLSHFVLLHVVPKSPFLIAYWIIFIMEDPIEIKYWLEDPTSEAAINECKRVRFRLLPCFPSS